MAVSERIERDTACDVINLAGEERAVYTGSGWKLARFENDRLVEFFDPLGLPYNPDLQAATKATLDAATKWLDDARGEVWLVMCSCGQLCEPKAISRSDAVGLAKMARVFREELAAL